MKVSIHVLSVNGSWNCEQKKAVWWKTFILLYGKHIQDNIDKTLGFVDDVTKTFGVFCGKYDKKHFGVSILNYHPV